MAKKQNEEYVLDYSSTKLAVEDIIPHAAVVKKLKKLSLIHI